MKTYGTGIGKYINKSKRENDEDIDAGGAKKKKGKAGLNDFSEW